MKKRTLFIAFGVIAIAAINLFVGVKSPDKSSDLALQNIDIVGISASETACDASTTSPCTIAGVGQGTGALIHID